MGKERTTDEEEEERVENGSERGRKEISAGEGRDECYNHPRNSRLSFPAFLKPGWPAHWLVLAWLR